MFAPLSHRRRFAASLSRLLLLALTVLTATSTLTGQPAGAAPVAAEGVLLSQGKPASGYPLGSDPTWEPAHANDGDIQTSWAPDLSNIPLPISTPVWWQVDLGKTYDLAKLVTTWNAGSWIYKYTVEVSNNGSNFTSVGSFSAASDGTGSAAPTTTNTFNASGRYVRIRFTSTNQNPPDPTSFPGIIVREFQIYGPGATTPVPTTPTQSATPTPLPGTMPVIQNIESRLGNFFVVDGEMPSYALRNDYTLTVDWNGDQPGAGVPGKVRTRLGASEQIVRADGATVNVTVDLLNNIDNIRFGGNQVVFIAESGAGSSAPSAAPLFAFSDWPPWLYELANENLKKSRITIEQGPPPYLKYKIVDARFPSKQDTDKQCKAQINVPNWVPFIGGKLGLPRPQNDIALTLTSRGSVTGNLAGKICLELPSAGVAKTQIDLCITHK